MDKKLSMKKADGKWWTYGSLKTNQWGNEQVSFKLSTLEELVAELKAQNKEWGNLSLFDNDKLKPNDGYQKHNEDKSNGYQPQEDLDDNVPF
jgi:hypothetical protein